MPKPKHRWAIVCSGRFLTTLGIPGRRQRALVIEDGADTTVLAYLRPEAVKMFEEFVEALAEKLNAEA